MSEPRKGYILKRDGNARTGPSVDTLLDKIQDLSPATTTLDGLMSSVDKTKLDELEDDIPLSFDDIADVIETEYHDD